MATENTFKERIKSLRKHVGLTQKEFTEKTGITQSSFSKYENGLRFPEYDFFLKIHKTFPEINIEWLITGLGDIERGLNIRGDFGKDNAIINDIFSMIQRSDIYRLNITIQHHKILKDFDEYI